MQSLARVCARPPCLRLAPSASLNPSLLVQRHTATSTRQYGSIFAAFRVPPACRYASGEATAQALSQQSVDELSADHEDNERAEKKGQQQEKQHLRPWHREGVDHSPVRRQRSAGAMTKGKLLTTPSRLLKLVMPLTTSDQNTDRKDVAPLALLVHPQQPLSYLERLIQAELPTISNDKGENRIPGVTFRAMESGDDEIKPDKNSKKGTSESESESEKEKDAEETSGVQSYSGAGREGKGEDDGDFVKWSASTEIGDFIRDAARAKEFEVIVEGNPEIIKIAVPSFNDRTFYLRQRLRRTSSKIAGLAQIKKECDDAAHRGAQRIALSGCGILVGYWYLVYRLTFETDLGWDTMEPVTYLVGLSTLIGGYMWFLWHNREVSYRQAMNITISSRQNKMYEAKGFEVQKWESLIEEANAIRREIKAVASEYDVEWDERKDEGDEAVTKALRDDRKNNGSDKEKKKSNKDDDDGDDD